MVNSGIYVIVFGMALSIALVVGPIAEALGKRYKVISVLGGRRVNDADSRGVSQDLAVYACFYRSRLRCCWRNICLCRIFLIHMRISV